MSMKTRKEVEKLKNDWLEDPIWDIETTEGFEEYHEELKKFANNEEKKWKDAQLKEAYKQIIEARNLGVEGLHRLLLKQQEDIEKMQNAISALCDGDRRLAYRFLSGYKGE